MAWNVGDKIKYKATKTAKWRKGKIIKKISAGKYELVGGKIVYEKDPDAIKESNMKLTKSKLKEIIREELKEASFDKYSKGVDTQVNVGNVFITKHDTGDITFHIGGKSDSSIVFNRRQMKELLQKLKKIGI